MKRASEQRAESLAKSHNEEPRNTRVSVLCEEYFALTKDALSAIVLHQFIYWSERIRDFDKFIQEENVRRLEEQNEPIPAVFGWIYKTCSEMAEEIMIGSESSVRRCIIELVKAGWLSERSNPKYKWDKTLQYHVNILKIAADLAKLGYAMPRYKIDTSKLHSESLKQRHESSEIHGDAAIPEITIETTTENITSSHGDDVLLSSTETTPENTIIKEIPNGRDKVTGLHLPASITSSARDTNDSKPKKVKYPPRTEMAHYLAANCRYPWKGFNSHAERDAWEKMEGEFPRDRIKSKIDWAVTTPGMGPGVIADRIMTAVTKWNSPKGQSKSKLIDEVLFGDNNGDSKDSKKVSHSVSATGGSRTAGTT